MPKAINRTSKGKRIEVRCSDELKKEGYLVWQSIRVKYQNLDLWGLFDVAAIHPDTANLLLIQCKSTRCANETRDKIRSFKVPPMVRKEIWIWKDAKGRIKEFYE